MSTPISRPSSGAVHAAAAPASAPIAVVIPYFQRQEGVLQKALASIAGQQLYPAEVIVVDDSSPVPAHGEVEAVQQRWPHLNVRVIEQPNGGPAAARNKGLDSVSPQCDYVAFLDSDDEWHDTHLLHANAALAPGNDFYFSDFFRLGQSKTVFEQSTVFRNDAHPTLPGSYPVAQFRGDMTEQILGANVIGTSTVVYRFRKFAALRFREEFVYAGEDFLFWLTLSTLTKAYVFGTTPEVTYGRGVNIYAGSGWGTEKSMDRLHYETKLELALPRLFKLNAEQQGRNRAKLRFLRHTMIKDIVHRLAHRKTVNAPLLRRHLAMDPVLPLYVPSVAWQIVAGRLRPQAAPRKD
ncbi:glycosyltransferase family 2 protein [Massilia oculi]|uniref:glycosyltransferase family 2 protein n=1 Tax=Massilia oculi TaxID=945844 RepID=UPI0028AB48B5|nr:glycosyltransferase family 2 protein [Massilia oculi]